MERCIRIERYTVAYDRDCSRRDIGHVQVRRVVHTEIQYKKPHFQYILYQECGASGDTAIQCVLAHRDQRGGMHLRQLRDQSLVAAYTI
eukprot:125935-Rhodomonas_salina.5